MEEIKGFTQDLVASMLEAGHNPITAYEGKVKGRLVHLENPVSDEIARRKRKSKKMAKRARMLGGAGPGIVVEDLGIAQVGKEKKVKSMRRKKTLTSKEKRLSGVYEIPKECRRYQLFIPLHKLWLQYFEEMIAECTSNDAILNKVIKADFHGAVFTVTQSKSSNFVGISGIMVKETENIFYIITRNDELKTLPKANNIFSFAFKDNLFTLYGNHVKGRPADRVAKKIKQKNTVEL